MAIKTLRSDRTDPRQIKRFRAEAAITALLEHPNIVPVHDLCYNASSEPQLVMKRVTGRAWRGLLNDNTANFDDNIRILLKVCDAIGFAHDRGILPRDLKPENVMVGEHGEVLVMDWSCAIHLGPISPHPDIPLRDSLVTISGIPVYMSPEQARLKRIGATPQTLKPAAEWWRDRK